MLAKYFKTMESGNFFQKNNNNNTFLAVLQLVPKDEIFFGNLCTVWFGGFLREIILISVFWWAKKVLFEDLGRIHLVLNGSLTDDTSVKWAQIKTFWCFIQFC